MSKFVVGATWDDVPHLSPEQKAELWGSIPPYQRDARSKGIPQLGSGAIYPVPKSEIVVDPFELPLHWPRGYGLDVGWNRTSAVWGAHDRDTNVVSVAAFFGTGRNITRTRGLGREYHDVKLETVCAILLWQNDKGASARSLRKAGKHRCRRRISRRQRRAGGRFGVTGTVFKPARSAESRNGAQSCLTASVARAPQCRRSFATGIDRRLSISEIVPEARSVRGYFRATNSPL